MAFSGTIFEAAAIADLDGIRKHISNKSVDINKQDEYQRTALYRAISGLKSDSADCSTKFLQAIQLLVQQNASLFVCSKNAVVIECRLIADAHALFPKLYDSLINAKISPDNLSEALEGFAVCKDLKFVKLMLDKGATVRNNPYADLNDQGTVLHRVISHLYCTLEIKEKTLGEKERNSYVDIIRTLIDNGAAYFYSRYSKDCVEKLQNKASKICNKIPELFPILSASGEGREQDILKEISHVKHPALGIPPLTNLIMSYSGIYGHSHKIIPDNKLEEAADSCKRSFGNN